MKPSPPRSSFPEIKLYPRNINAEDAIPSSPRLETARTPGQEAGKDTWAAPNPAEEGMTRHTATEL